MSHSTACQTCSEVSESLRPLPPRSLTTSAQTTEVDQRRQPATMRGKYQYGNSVTYKHTMRHNKSGVEKKSNFGIFLFCSFLLKSIITHHHHHHTDSKQLNFYVSWFINALHFQLEYIVNIHNDFCEKSCRCAALDRFCNVRDVYVIVNS